MIASPAAPFAGFSRLCSEPRSSPRCSRRPARRRAATSSTPHRRGGDLVEALALGRRAHIDRAPAPTSTARLRRARARGDPWDMKLGRAAIAATPPRWDSRCTWQSQSTSTASWPRLRGYGRAGSAREADRTATGALGTGVTSSARGGGAPCSRWQRRQLGGRPGRNSARRGPGTFSVFPRTDTTVCASGKPAREAPGSASR